MNLRGQLRVVGGYGGLLVERESPLALAAEIDAGHQTDKSRTVCLPVGNPAVHQCSALWSGVDELRLTDVVAEPGGRLSQSGDHGVAVHDLTIGQDHPRVLGHHFSVERNSCAIAERV